MKEYPEFERELTEALEGKTISQVRPKRYGLTGSDGAMDSIDIVLTDGTLVEFKAGSYCIPEESCIYTDVR